MKNKIRILFIGLLVSGLGFSQAETPPKKDSAVTRTSRIMFRKSQNMPTTIYLLGGIVSAITQKEIDFGKKYHVAFHDFGCVVPSNLEDYEKRNLRAFDLLEVRFGPKWKEELNPNTFGLKKWLDKNK